MYFMIIKMNNFWGDLTAITAKRAPGVHRSYSVQAYLPSSPEYFDFTSLHLTPALCRNTVSMMKNLPSVTWTRTRTYIHSCWLTSIKVADITSRAYDLRTSRTTPFILQNWRILHPCVALFLVPKFSENTPFHNKYNASSKILTLGMPSADIFEKN